MSKMDFYYSRKQELAVRTQKRMNGDTYSVARWKGKKFTEQINQGRTPLSAWDDLVKVGTGDSSDCTYGSD